MIGVQGTERKEVPRAALPAPTSGRIARRQMPLRVRRACFDIRGRRKCHESDAPRPRHPFGRAGWTGMFCSESDDHSTHTCPTAKLARPRGRRTDTHTTRGDAEHSWLRQLPQTGRLTPQALLRGQTKFQRFSCPLLPDVNSAPGAVLGVRALGGTRGTRSCISRATEHPAVATGIVGLTSIIAV